MSQAEQQTEGIKAFISNQIISGNMPPEEAEAALELLGTLDPDGTEADTVHPELAPAEEPMLVSRSWAKTHR
ncbi:hypothetical protein [Arthrobacter sp. zg-Y1110]|uniref:hypothetical protein n=1 Tax=Arthrobacter sp. zg-Y1110 TaxID=2886932 RepID=UPI001D14912F|nr:hypothetical protein [Arthrobacter sp. zg-Y1110]MCC3292475.1 hypothetical protein [Arthrobacter sp. zg-Y1110]UWX87092.1 hypothetical protein N2K99_17225 [Arthrobacter sp. zg-Y1110]